MYLTSFLLRAMLYANEQKCIQRRQYGSPNRLQTCQLVHNLLQHGTHTSETVAMLYSSFDKLGRFKVFTDVSCSRGWSCESIKIEILKSVFCTFICQKTVEKDKLNLNISLAKKLNRPGPFVDHCGRPTT